MKRVWTLLVACLFFLGIFPLGVAAEEEPPVDTGIAYLYTKADLDAVRRTPGIYYVLEADLVFTPEDFAEGGAFYNEGRGWIPIGDEESPFTGLLQGNGHTISGLQCTADGSGAPYGLFGVNDGLIEGLVVEDFSVTGSVSDAGFVGAIAGENSGTIVNCVNLSQLSGPQPGGIVGHNRGEVIGCANFGDIQKEPATSSALLAAGGIAALNTGLLYDCANFGQITAQGTARLGGIVGDNRHDTADTAGISGTVMFCVNSGPVEGTDPLLTAGGICAFNDYLLIGCINAAPVTGSWIGGIAGFHAGTLSVCINSGVVTGDRYAGGLVGCCDNEIGLFPLENAAISDSYNVGSVSGAGSIGGIAGYTERGALSCVYSVGAIDTAGAQYSGGITGGTQVVSDCFSACYYLQTSGDWTAEQLAAQEGIACTADDLRRTATFSSFDFEDVWYQIDNGEYAYPQLVAFAQPGDVNTDGLVNSSDARLVLQNTVGTAALSVYRQLLADVNQDGAINSSDARSILQQTVSLF